MSFRAYLDAKNIDYELFIANAPAELAQMELLFEQLHSDSFTMQKKFLINDWRKKFGKNKGK
jgi:hypothetical protein